MDDNQATVASKKALEAKMSEAEYAVYQDKLRAEAKARNGVADRECGECTACCTILSVREIGKPGFHRCQHDCGGGCAVYHNRPRSCRSWSCGWLLGHIEGDERRRPDKIGLIFNREMLAGENVAVVIEVWPGAAKESANAYMLGKMSQKEPIIVREYQIRNYDVVAPNPQQRQRLFDLIHIHWNPHLYGQIVVSNF